jgi:hypothetical protein
MVLAFHKSFKDYEEKKIDLKESGFYKKEVIENYSWTEHIKRNPVDIVMYGILAIIVAIGWPMTLPIGIIVALTYFLYKKLKPFLDKTFLKTLIIKQHEKVDLWLDGSLYHHLLHHRSTRPQRSGN